MKSYELVVVLKSSLSLEEKKNLIFSIEEILGDGVIQETDDMGIMKSAYPLQRKKENNAIHIISYHIFIDSQKIADYNKKFAYLNGLIRHFFYVMSPSQKFITYSELQKKIEKEISFSSKEKTIS